MRERPDRIRDLSREEVDQLTGGGLLRALPIVKLFDMLRGKSRPAFKEQEGDEPKG